MDFEALYSRFERAVSALLMLGMVIVILLASWSFLRATAMVAGSAAGPLDYATFQHLFDRVLAAIIALELAHSVQQMVAGKHGLAQVRTVVIIGVLAVVRKLIVLEVDSTSGVFLIGIAAAVLSLGAIFVLIVWVEQGDAAAQRDDGMKN